MIEVGCCSPPIVKINDRVDKFMKILTNSKVFTLQAILHHSESIVLFFRRICEFYYKKSRGSCYVAPSLPSSCFLGDVTGLFFCLYFKIFASSVYALFDC